MRLVAAVLSDIHFSVGPANPIPGRVAVQLNHFAGFPERRIRDLSEKVKGNPFSAQVLELLVVGHLMLYKIDDDARKRTALVIGVKPKSLLPPKE